MIFIANCSFNKETKEGHYIFIKGTIGDEDHTIVIPYSSLSKQGREEIYELLDRMAGNTES